MTMISTTMRIFRRMSEGIREEKSERTFLILIAGETLSSCFTPDACNRITETVTRRAYFVACVIVFPLNQLGLQTVSIPKDLRYP